MLSPLHTEETMKEYRVISIEIDRAPEGDKEFARWVESRGCIPLGASPRRAWCGDYSSYFREAIGFGITKSGETFLIYEEDLNGETAAS